MHGSYCFRPRKVYKNISDILCMISQFCQVIVCTSTKTEDIIIVTDRIFNYVAIAMKT